MSAHPEREDLLGFHLGLLDAEERLLSVRFQTKLAEITVLLLSGQLMDYIGPS